MTLTETATMTKRFLRVFLIFGGAFLALWLAYLYIYNNIYIPYQRSQVKAEQRFGALPKSKFPSSIISSASLTYSLDTPSGFLPDLAPRTLKVYFIPPLETTLLGPDRARKLATSLDFSQGPDILSPTQYKFSDGQGGSMTINLNNGNFVSTRAQPPADAPQDPQLLSVEQLGPEFRNYLSSKALLKPGLETAPFKVSFNTDNTQATISLWQGNIEKDIPIVTPSPKKSLIWAIATRYKGLYHYQAINYTYWAIDPLTFSTYYAKSVSQAFEELKKGGGVVVDNSTSGSKASISKIYLAYYLPEEYNSFLEPVYVFEGEQFSAYVPALTDPSYAQ